MPFILTYVFQDITKQKKRSFLIVIGLMIDVCMVSALFTWMDTGPIIFAKDHLERSFQMSLSKPLSLLSLFEEDFKYSMWQTHDFVKKDPLIGNIEAVYTSLCLFNTENRPDSYIWYPKAEEPIITGFVFITNDAFINLTLNDLKLEGLSPNSLMGNDSVFLSRALVSKINETLGISYKAGSKISFALATRFAEHKESENTLKYWERVFFKNLTVKGIYDWVPQESFVSRALYALHIYMLENTMFMPLSLINSTVRATMETEPRRRPGPPMLFIQVDADEVVRRGIINFVDEIRKLSMRISHSCDNEIIVRDDRDEILKFTDAYNRSRTLLIYVLPVVGLATSVTVFSSEVTFRGRKREVEVLRSKGASSGQLYTIFFIEFITLALIGTALGFMLGLFLGCLIPATTGILQYDSNMLGRFLSYIRISPNTFLFSLVICGTTPLIYALGKAKSYSSAEVISAQKKVEELKYTVGFWEIEVKGLGISYVFFAGMLAALFFFKWFINTSSLTMEGSVFFYTLLLSHWLSFVYATALVISKILPQLSRIFAFALKAKGLLITLDFKRQRIFTPLIIVLILTSSVMVFSLVEAETTQNNTMNQIRYMIGCDFRIVTTGEQPISFAQNLTEKFSDRISKAMPVLFSHGMLTNFYLKLVGIDPMLYKDMSVWMPYKDALVRLAENPSGMIISDSVADALNLDLNSQVRIKRTPHTGPSYYTNFTVVGMMYSAPGFGDANPTYESLKESLDFQEKRQFALVNKDLLIDEGINMTSLFFACAKDGTNDRETAEILSKMPEVSVVYAPSTFDLSKVDIYRFLYMRGVTGSLTIQFLITTIIGILSLVFFLEYMISERNVEYAVMRAVGATQKDVTLLIFLESIEVVLVSLIAGSLLGVLYSITLFDLSLQIFPFKSVVPYMIAAPIITLVIGFGAVFLSMLLGSYSPSKKAGNTDVARVLRNL